MLLSDLCRGQRRDAGLLVVAFGSPGGDHCIWDLERLIEYGRGDDAVGSKVPDVVAQFAPRADERRRAGKGYWDILELNARPGRIGIAVDDPASGQLDTADPTGWKP